MIRKTPTHIAIAALLVGCQTTGGQQGMQPGMQPQSTCATPVCQIRINVTDAGFITVDPEILHIAKGNQGPGNRGVTIHWVLQNGQYEFKADGIAFYDPNHRSQFFDAAPQGNGAQFQWKDRNTKVDPAWAYQIKVYKRGTAGPPLSRDPAIFNDGG